MGRRAIVGGLLGLALGLAGVGTAGVALAGSCPPPQKVCTPEEEPPPPTLAEVRAALAGGDAEAGDLAFRLAEYTHGDYAGVFGRRADAAADGRVVAWDLGGVGDDARVEAAGVYLLADALWTAARRDRRPRLALIDEAWKLIQHPAGAAVVADLVSRGRKYGLAVVLMTQEIRSLLDSPFGQRLLVNAARKLLVGQGRDLAALGLLAETLQLGPGEVEWLRTVEPGRALLLAGDERRALRVTIAPEERALITTDPAEVAARTERRGGPPWPSGEAGR
jgi:hypothetical protein